MLEPAILPNEEGVLYRSGVVAGVLGIRRPESHSAIDPRCLGWQDRCLLAVSPKEESRLLDRVSKSEAALPLTGEACSNNLQMEQTDSD
jgi:hypothetical protein